jgi:hypothetical protein
MKVPAFTAQPSFSMERKHVPRPGNDALNSRRTQAGGGAASVPAHKNPADPSAPARKTDSLTGDCL